MRFSYLFTLAIGVFFGQVLQAQSQAESFNCGVDLAEGDLIFQQLQENRRNISPEEIEQFMNSRTTKYIPTRITIVGDANGNGYVPIDNVFSMLCGTNDLYATQNIAYYLKEANGTLVRYLNNANIYNNASSFNASSAMINNRLAQSLNIYLSASVQSQVASYYSSFGDYVFILNSMSQPATCAHEIGHFFTLPHTFYGWEGIDLSQYGTGNVPNSVGGATTERAERSGPCSNCATAGDGFCDTPADYMSDRAPCPYNGGVKDFCGVAINPEESLLMSYYFDACVDSFSPQQKGAMAADIIARQNANTTNVRKFPNNLSTLPTPSNLVTGTAMTAISPTAGSIVATDGSDITLTWSAVTGATAYVVVVERVFLGVVIGTIENTIVYNSNSLTIAASKFNTPADYRWRVKPFNAASFCGAYSSSFNFSTAIVTNIEVPFNEAAELRILSNPVSHSTVEMLIAVPEDLTASIKLYSLDGRQIANVEKVKLSAGDNLQMLDASNLAAGLYVVVVSTEKGSLQQKITVIR